MTDQNVGHLTSGRRRRHKSPSSVQNAPLLPVPRLADYLDTDFECGRNWSYAYLQTPPEPGPSVVQVTSGLQNWQCAGRRLVEIAGRLPRATQLHQFFIKILAKHLASNKMVNFVFQQKSSIIPMTEIVELFSFVEVTLIATVAGHFPGVAASSVKPKLRLAPS